MPRESECALRMKRNRFLSQVISTVIVYAQARKHGFNVSSGNSSLCLLLASVFLSPPRGFSSEFNKVITVVIILLLYF